MIVWGITAQNHDASICVLKDKEILFASSSERFSGIKNDKNLNSEIVNYALSFGKPDRVVFYENPWKKKLRQFLSFDWKYLLNFFSIKKFNINNKIEYIDHHLSHALAGYNTSNFDKALIVVIDALGEFKTCSILKAENDKIQELYSITFPSSIGLLYSAFTKRCGLKPNEEEYILMGMSSYGKPIFKEKIEKDFIDRKELFSLKRFCTYGIEKNYLKNERIEDIAASIQSLVEDYILKIILYGKGLYNCENLVYMGGVALNCLANTKLIPYFKNIWIMPNPGDSGSCIGAASYIVGKLNWKNPYLGKNVDKEININKICSKLAKGEVIGLIAGKAEFGPRALGNRSILANPLYINIKNKVDIVKKRQRFRPFSPAILKEKVKDYFEMPINESPYMQYIFKCKKFEKFKSVCNIDGFSRIQTVSKENNHIFYSILKEFYSLTGCPMLLNTSLNIKGKPIANDFSDLNNINIEVL